MRHQSQAKYEERKRKAGLVKVAVWIPEGQRRNLINHAKELVRKWEANGGGTSPSDKATLTGRETR